MTLQLFAKLFNRALTQSVNKKSCFLLFAALLCVSFLFVFFRAMQQPWLGSSLLFIPLFLGMALLLAIQIPLTKLYLKPDRSLKELFGSSVDQMLKTSYLVIPLLLLYLLVWFLTAIFALLTAIPVLGPFLNVVLIFAPFLLNVMSLLLGVATLVLSFFVCPRLALGEKLDRHVVQKYLLANSFRSLLFFFTATAVLYIAYKLLMTAAQMTVLDQTKGLSNLLQSLFLAIPFVALLVPAVSFFFNFAAESATCEELQEGSS
ncbi:MAG: hypothetical protein S4CHLAM81_12460 [Chlamydiales bacterium]|nr:hypothetical protein [Chlamydiales bacterium]MCH9636021.1 hypothetical protein [Chlamydiales bacterium]MCH9703947.1 hypothetical protein [Chlamydiota bacterium]